jgi:hypothetical protein
VLLYQVAEGEVQTAGGLLLIHANKEKTMSWNRTVTSKYLNLVYSAAPIVFPIMFVFRFPSILYTQNRLCCLLNSLQHACHVRMNISVVLVAS